MAESKIKDRASKICTKCSRLKPLSEFGRETKSGDGRSYMCKDCSRQRNKIKIASERGDFGDLSIYFN